MTDPTPTAWPVTVPAESVGVEVVSEAASAMERERKAKVLHDRWTKVLFYHWMIVAGLFFMIFPAMALGPFFQAAWDFAMVFAGTTVAVNQALYWGLSNRLTEILGRRAKRARFQRVRERSTFAGELSIDADGNLAIAALPGAPIDTVRDTLGEVPDAMAESLPALPAKAGGEPPEVDLVDVDDAALHLVRTQSDGLALELAVGRRRVTLGLGAIEVDDMDALPMIDRPAIALGEAADAVLQAIVERRDAALRQVPDAIRRLAERRAHTALAVDDE